MSEDNRHTDDARTAQTAQVQESSIFAPLGRVKGVLIVSMVLAVCVMALELPFWFRAVLLALVVLGIVAAVTL